MRLSFIVVLVTSLWLAATARAGDRGPLHLAYVDVSAHPDPTVAASVREQVLGAILQCGAASIDDCMTSRNGALSNDWTSDRRVHDPPPGLDVAAIRSALRGGAADRRAARDAFDAPHAPREYVDAVIAVDIAARRVTVSVLLRNGQRIARTTLAHDAGAIAPRALSRLERALVRPMLSRIVV